MALEGVPTNNLENKLFGIRNLDRWAKAKEWFLSRLSMTGVFNNKKQQAQLDKCPSHSQCFNSSVMIHIMQ